MTEFDLIDQLRDCHVAICEDAADEIEALRESLAVVGKEALEHNERWITENEALREKLAVSRAEYDHIVLQCDALGEMRQKNLARAEARAEAAEKERDEAVTFRGEISLDREGELIERAAAAEKRAAVLREALKDIQHVYGSPEDEDAVTTIAREALAADSAAGGSE